MTILSAFLSLCAGYLLGRAASGYRIIERKPACRCQDRAALASASPEDLAREAGL